ncbi:MAG: hypothetical protein U0R64_04925 [Candidatus Nanopelagicales bacterium]
MAAFAVATAVAAVLPGPTAQYFGGLLWQSDRPGVPVSWNQSPRDWWSGWPPVRRRLFPALIVLALGVIAVRRQRRDPWLSLTAAAVTGLLVSPVSWTHHWVWVLPVAAVSWRWRRELPVLAWSGAALVAATALLTGPAVGLDYSWLAALWVFAGENAYVLAALFWLAAAAWRGPTEPVAGQPANPVLSAG